MRDRPSVCGTLLTHVGFVRLAQSSTDAGQDRAGPRPSSADLLPGVIRFDDPSVTVRRIPVHVHLPCPGTFFREDLCSSAPSRNGQKNRLQPRNRCSGSAVGSYPTVQEHHLNVWQMNAQSRVGATFEQSEGDVNLAEGERSPYLPIFPEEYA